VQHRRTKLSRPAVGHTREKVIAANIGLVVIVASVAKPAFSPDLIDRYLIAAQAGGAEPVLCLNKTDLVEKEPPLLAFYRDLGIRVIRTSCATGEGISTLREVLAQELSVLAGHSGVGKSSLVNVLEPALNIETQEISESTRKGRHTTSTSRLYVLGSGARIIDTPGIRQLGLWGISPEEVDYYFHELAEAAPRCRFRDCTHVHEPGCAIKSAVDSGAISRARYESYVRIRRSLLT
jgi:ribosome biogenesis GTPase